MEQMARRIVLAALLGALVGVAVGYSPLVQPTSAPRPQLLMQQTGQPNIAFSPLHPSLGPTSLLLALVAGFVVAAPLFLVSKRRNEK